MTSTWSRAYAQITVERGGLSFDSPGVAQAVR
jgi:hypothetical protein